MLPDAIVSCGLLLIGCGSCAYHLIHHSDVNYGRILPEFAFASAGFAAIGARSLFRLGYSLFWRKYPINPLQIEQELLSESDERNIVDSTLSTIALTTILCSLYHHHNHQTIGFVVTGSLAVCEIICLKKIDESEELEENSDILTTIHKFGTVVDGWIAWLWIFSTGIFGWKVGNNYIRLATVPCIISMIYPPEKFYRGWSIKNCLMDYMMLTYIILITEALHRPPINQ